MNKVVLLLFIINLFIVSQSDLLSDNRDRNDIPVENSLKLKKIVKVDNLSESEQGLIHVNKVKMNYIYALIIVSSIAIILLSYLIIKLKRINNKNAELLIELGDKNEELNLLVEDKDQLLTKNIKIVEDLSNYQRELEFQNLELANSEYKLEILKNKYYELYNSAPIAYLSLSEHFDILDANDKALELLEIHKTDYNKVNFINLLAEESKSDFHFSKDSINESSIIECELTINIPDGKIHTIAEFKLFYDDNLKKNIVFTTVLDITEKKVLEKSLKELNKNLEKIIEERTLSLQNTLKEKEKTENELRDSERFIYNFTNKLPVGVYRTTKEGKIIFANNKLINILGFETISELQSYFVEDLFVDRTIRSTFIEQLDASPKTYEFQMKRKDGKLIWVRDTGTSELNHLTNEMYLDGIIEDITVTKQTEYSLKQAFEQLKETKNKLEEANELKGIILGNLGHELRTPLNGILGFSQLLLEEIFDVDQKDMLNMIVDSASRLHKTLNSLLSITELEAKVTSLNMNFIELDLIINNVVSQFYSSIEEKSLKLVINQSIENPIVYTDEFLLNQVLFNVLDNAIKFTNEGSINIRTNDNAKYMSLEIEDTGIGISEEKLDSVFEAFRQDSEGYSRKFEGVGIGLTITKKIIDMISARISIESEVNKGTKITIFLPKEEFEEVNENEVDTNA